jgi:hypothetical protein
MKLGSHMPDGEMRKPIDNEVCRTKVKVTTSKNRTKILYFILNLSIMRIVGQRSRSQLLKIEQKLDACFVSARYLKYEMSDLNETWYTHARW